MKRSKDKFYMKQILTVFQMERSLQLERLPKKSDYLKSLSEIG